MRYRSPFAHSVVSIGLLAASARGAEFVANHLFVADSLNTAIRELDSAGNVVRSFGGATLVDPRAMAFGPDGLLYVLDERGSEPNFDRIVVFSPEGDTLAQLAVGPEVSFEGLDASIVAGRRGRFFVSDSIGSEVHDFDPDLGIVDTLVGSPLLGAARMTLGPAERLYVSAGGDPTTVVEFDASGIQLAQSDATPTGNTAPPPLLARGGDGAVVRLERPSSGNGGFLSVAFSGIGGPAPLPLSQGPFVDLTVGPDGRYWILAEGGASLLRVDRQLASVEELSYVPATAATAFAFAPFRFSAKLKTKRLTDGGITSTTEKGVMLTYFAGTERVFVEFDDADDPEDVASLFGAGPYAFVGTAYPDAEGDAIRLHGTTIERVETVDLVGQARLRLVGTVGATSSYFRLQSPRGDIVLSRGGVAFECSIESSKALD